MIDDIRELLLEFSIQASDVSHQHFPTISDCHVRYQSEDE